MPRIIKQTYQKGTRTMDGKPGKNYWQNTARYTISYGSMITFVRDATTKAVTSLTLSAQGNELSAKKEKP